jgi:hypothetical protein
MHTDMMGRFQHMTLKSEGPGDMFGQCCMVSLGLKGKIVMKINKNFKVPSKISTVQISPEFLSGNWQS